MNQLSRETIALILRLRERAESYKGDYETAVVRRDHHVMAAADACKIAYTHLADILESLHDDPVPDEQIRAYEEERRKRG